MVPVVVQASIRRGKNSVAPNKNTAVFFCYSERGCSPTQVRKCRGLAPLTNKKERLLGVFVTLVLGLAPRHALLLAGWSS